MSLGPNELRIFDDAADLAQAVADELLRRSRGRAESGGEFTLALSGGSTPLRLYRLLAGQPYSDAIPWRHLHFFWGDERAVPPRHSESNYGAAQQALFSKLAIPPGNIHRIRAELADSTEAAAAYERDLRHHFGLSSGAIPRFDLVLLGMGADGHTASLFPGSEALAEQRRLVAAPWVEKLKTYRITLTCPVLNNAACIMFLVSGGEKAKTLRAVLEGPAEPSLYPAQLIRPLRGELVWFVDEAAAVELKQRGSAPGG